MLTKEYTMWNLFRPKPLLSEDDQFFQFECYKWLLTHFGGDDFYQSTQLILPTKVFFPTEVNSQETAAKVTFEQVKKYAGMERWPCSLVAQDEDPNLLIAPTVVVQDAEQNPLGTFSADENNEIIITYNPKIVSDPIQMVATFAHELSHYLTGTAPEPPPGGWDNWEFATDIGTTFLGFGIFVANAAFNFQQHSTAESQGWQISGGGYLSEAEYSYALAIFLKLKNIPYDQVHWHCDLNIRNYLKKALVELEENSIIKELRQVNYAPRPKNA